MVVKARPPEHAPPIHVVQVTISTRILTAIPARALDGVPHDGTVSDLLGVLLSQALRRGIRVYGRQRQQHRTMKGKR